jgi:methylenetetrahydrofolate dehydrogenase (NADP+)/methenyltetrahydrofolate cyclohydrolase
VFDMTEIINGKKIADKILGQLKKELSQLNTAGLFPRLVVILAGQNPASLNYIRIKQKRAQEIGLKVDLKSFPEDVAASELVAAIRGLNQEQNVCGILVQLPLPGNLPAQEILDAVSPDLDVDCLTTVNKQKLVTGKEIKFFPPAPAAILKLLEEYKVDLKGHILLVGSGELVGRPLAAMLLNRGLSFEVANRHTDNLSQLAVKADVLITAVGKPDLIIGSMVKKGSVIIDAGTTGSANGDIKGDVESDSVLNKARLFAPVPGGVGPVTVAMLLGNGVKVASSRLRSQREI